MRDDDLYDPRPIEDDLPPSEPARAASGYRIRSDATWALARAAFLDGETAESVCERFDLSLGTFRERARHGGWRRCDQPDPEPLPVDASEDVDADAGYAELADHALRQMRRAIARGRASAAVSWMRLHERLLARAETETRAEAEAARKVEAAARPVPPALQAVRDRLFGRLEPHGVAPVPPTPGPNPHDPHDPHPVSHPVGAVATTDPP